MASGSRTTLVRSRGVSWRAGPFGVVAAAGTDEEPTALAGAAALAWDELAAPCTTDELVESLARRSGVAPDEIRTDVEETVAELVRRGLLETRCS